MKLLGVIVPVFVYLYINSLKFSLFTRLYLNISINLASFIQSHIHQIVIDLNWPLIIAYFLRNHVVFLCLSWDGVLSRHVRHRSCAPSSLLFPCRLFFSPAWWTWLIVDEESDRRGAQPQRHRAQTHISSGFKCHGIGNTIIKTTAFLLKTPNFEWIQFACCIFFFLCSI